MAKRTFIDTNILVYANDESLPDKKMRAQHVLHEAVSTSAAVLSTQVLQEFFNAATRKLAMPASDVRTQVELLSQLDVVVVRPAIILAAIDATRLHSLSFWDALILRSAAVAGCVRLLSEDMQHDQVIDGVRIENPFLSPG